MLRDITLGQYYSADSLIHKMDPRTKIIGTFVLIVSLFLFKNIAAFAVATVWLILVIKLSKVPFSFMIRGMRSIVFLMIITVIFNMLLTPGEELFHFFRFSITKEGVANAGFTLVRLVYLIIGSSIMTLTTTPNNLTDGLEKLMSPLKVFKVPVHEVAMMMSIALRFIPILLDETDKIMKAQEARGADFEHGNLIKRAKAMIPILVPLFVSAFRRANDLAMAMESRCYRGGEGRTKMKPLKYGKVDAFAYLAMAIYLTLIIVSGLFSPI